MKIFLKKRFNMATLVAVSFCLITGCTKTMEDSAITPNEAAGTNSSVGSAGATNSNSPIVQKHSYPVYGREGNTVAYVHIDGERGGVARVNIEVLDPWFFSFGQTYDVAFYNGTWYTDVYAQLNVLTSDQDSRTTFPVKDVTGKVLRASDLLGQNLRIKINAPYETVGIGQIQ